ncbi:hypothetical protein GCM10022252_47250 [Streptosporangium oxazolinicum]|uniref:Uncharacterized protein n=1 Tax=Streptosporangium oxazolinicum TaxID=909287 RepID=A0ABP8B4L7_9ACTN
MADGSAGVGRKWPWAAGGFVGVGRKRLGPAGRGGRGRPTGRSGLTWDWLGPFGTGCAWGGERAWARGAGRAKGGRNEAPGRAERRREAGSGPSGCDKHSAAPWTGDSAPL